MPSCYTLKSGVMRKKHVPYAHHTVVYQVHTKFMLMSHLKSLFLMSG